LRNHTQLTRVYTFLGVLRSHFKKCRPKCKGRSYQCVHPVASIMESKMALDLSQYKIILAQFLFNDNLK